jgi:hypothetical protein
MSTIPFLSSITAHFEGDEKRKIFHDHTYRLYHENAEFHARVTLVLNGLLYENPGLLLVIRKDFLIKIIAYGLASKDLDLRTGEAKDGP